MLEKLTNDLAAAKNLSDEQVLAAVEQLVSGSVSAASKAEFLCKLALKGETVEEISAFARALREKSIVPPIDAETRSREILDVCGTGGDRLNTFNISTTVALICASAGIAVAKHGNRAITSQSGSADVLEALGIRVDLTPVEAARSLREHNFAFFFAPSYHPLFKHIAPARKLCADRGQRTIFNFLGPLLNPARPSAQLVGVSSAELCEPMAKVLKFLGVKRIMVVSGSIEEELIGDFSQNSRPNIDELSTLGPTALSGSFNGSRYDPDQITSSIIAYPNTTFTLQSASLNDLLGGNREANAEIIRRILRGDERGPKRDAVLLNAGQAFFVANKASTPLEGWTLAAKLIDDGTAIRKLKELSQAA